ncbi:hypothetical protein DWW31_18100 [Clostridium sp. AF15-17LB]|nr:hypothetical protein DWW31_18100 [Clostridium sp. AF15-17LB]
MSLIIPTFEERRANEKERMDIINNIMAIQTIEHLHILSNMSKRFYRDEISDLPLTVNEFVDLLDFPLLVRMMDMFQNEPSEYMANSQIKELLKKAIDTYSGLEEDEEQTA